MDLINREDSLACFWNYANNDGTGYDETDMPAYDRLQALPIVAEVEDCISRQAAIDALGEKPLVWDDFSDFDLGKAAQWSDDVDAIKELPSAQPQRMKGKWLRNESDLSWWFECSKCGESPLYNPYADEVLTSFCPWCGAEMEVE